jgi:hypothetical protein
MPPTLEHLVQEMGQVAQCHRDGINDSYHIFATVSGLAALIRRAHGAVRDRSTPEEIQQLTIQMTKLHQVLQLLVVDSKCYHVATETYFWCPES